MKYMSEFDESRPTETLYDDERHQRTPLQVRFCGTTLQGPTSRFLPLPESSQKKQALKRRANKSTELASVKRRRFQPSSSKSAKTSRRSTRNGNCSSVAMCTDENPYDGQMMDCDDDDDNNNNNNNGGNNNNDGDNNNNDDDNKTRSKRAKRCTRAGRRRARDNSSSSEDDDNDASRSRSALSRGASRSLRRTRRLKGILKRSKRKRRRRNGSRCGRRVRFKRKVMVRTFVSD